MPFLLLIGCSTNEKDIIFHYSVLKALDNGVLEGDMKVSELKKKGDFGLGTFNKLNGEMIILDHIVYRVSPEGKIIQPDDETLIPYSVITFLPSGRHPLYEWRDQLPVSQGLRCQESTLYESFLCIPDKGTI
jgi:hypothetical protein